MFVQGKEMPPPWKSPLNHHAGYGSSKPTAAPHLFQGQLHCSEDGWLSVCNVSKHNQKNSPLLLRVCVSLSYVQLSVTSQTVAQQAPLSMEYTRQEYWSGLPFPFPRNLFNPGIKPKSLALQADSLPLSHQGSPKSSLTLKKSKENK